MLPSFRTFLPLACQVTLCIFGLAVMGFAPPAQGAILIVSLQGESMGEIARWAVDRQARLLGAGPVPNSIVVIGERAALGGIALRQRAMLLAGSATGCGRETPA